MKIEKVDILILVVLVLIVIVWLGGVAIVPLSVGTFHLLATVMIIAAAFATGGLKLALEILAAILITLAMIAQ